MKININLHIRYENSIELNELIKYLTLFKKAVRQANLQHQGKKDIEPINIIRLNGGSILIEFLITVAEGVTVFIICEILKALMAKFKKYRETRVDVGKDKNTIDINSNTKKKNK